MPPVTIIFSEARPAAVALDFLAIDVAGLVAGKKQNRVRQVFRHGQFAGEVSSLLVLLNPNSSDGGMTSGMSVTTPPGERALQRMPSSMYMNAVFFVAARTAPLLAQ